MDRETFESIVIEALDSLPPEFARYLTNVEVRIEARPSREQRRALGLRPWQTIYGLYEGVPLTERTDGDPLIPDVITIFQAPLVRDFPSRDALRERCGARCCTKSPTFSASAMSGCTNWTPTEDVDAR
jgi:Uncharacterized protein conserved in bacteria